MEVIFMQKRRCCFIGHSLITDPNTENKIIKTAESLITDDNVNEFWVGKRGDFDHLAVSAIQTLKKKYPQIRLIRVVSYHSEILREHDTMNKIRYDETIISNIPEKTPMKFRIIKTNEFMVDNSDFLICFVKFSWGGAYRTYEYAKRNRRIGIINICNDVCF